MARAALGWTVRELAERAAVARYTVTRFEVGERLRPRTIDAIKRCFEQHGIEFIGNGRGPGVRLRPDRDIETTDEGAP